MGSGNWYKENYGTIIFFIILPMAFFMCLIKAFAHVDLIDTGMILENIEKERRAIELEEARMLEKERRDQERQLLIEEERYYRMMCEKHDKEKKDQGFDYYCKKD
jgi:hypothetical protein